MIIVDKKLHERARQNEPIRVGMIGAGFLGKALALQIATATAGMRLAAISNRHGEEAVKAFRDSGVSSVHVVSGAEAVDDVISRGSFAVTENAADMCKARAIDVVIEMTGDVEFGAEVAYEAIRNGKHVIVNAEVDATVGPILKVHADRAGVVFSGIDGDQPGTTLNLVRFIRGIGLRPVLCGNIKGLHDPYRNPATQESFARKWGQQPYMVTTFADGTKISLEQTEIANAMGMGVGRRGMFGPTVPEGTPVLDAPDWYPHEALLSGKGIVDYVVGASPAPGVFVLAICDDPSKRFRLNLLKLGEGPFYCFYTPYHLCQFEIPNGIARAVLFNDATIAPEGPPTVGVVTTAKRDLRAGEVLDGMGRYTAYGQCENYGAMVVEKLLPIGLSAGCRLVRDIPRDQVITYDDVFVPPGRFVDTLYSEQHSHFFGGPSEEKGDG